MFSSVVTVHPTLVCGSDDDKVGICALVSRVVLRNQFDQSRSDVISTEVIQHEGNRAWK